jgi:hypothetical protein
MKAERRPLELHGTNGALPGTMALPMLDLQALRARVLEGEVVGLRQQVALLSKLARP